MRVIVAGGREFKDQVKLSCALDDIIKSGDTIISGMAKGADEMGAEYAYRHKDLELNMYPADWKRYGKSAGHVRNAEMADTADILIAFWDGKSKGTKGMIEVALKNGLEIHVYRYTKESKE